MSYAETENEKLKGDIVGTFCSPVEVYATATIPTFETCRVHRKKKRKRLAYIEGLEEIIDHGKTHCCLHSTTRFSIAVTLVNCKYVINSKIENNKKDLSL